MIRLIDTLRVRVLLIRILIWRSNDLRSRSWPLVARTSLLWQILSVVTFQNNQYLPQACLQEHNIAIVCPSINKGVSRHPNVDDKNRLFCKKVQIATDIVDFGSIMDILMKEFSLFFEAFIPSGTLTGTKTHLVTKSALIRGRYY